MLLVGFPVHEFMHAWTAYRLGDNTARWAGRVTLDPRVHFDQMGGIFLGLTAVFGALSGGGLLFGWAKPTPVNPMNLRNGRQGHALVAFAGPASNLVIAAIVAIPLRLIIHNDDCDLYLTSASRRCSTWPSASSSCSSTSTSCSSSSTSSPSRRSTAGRS